MFKLRRPCENCPWRTDLEPYLDPKRAAEIIQGVAFQCHKTVDYSGDEPAHGDHPQQCAGLMIVLHRSGHPNQIMQVGERLGAFDPERLSTDSPIYDDLWQALEAHDGDPAEELPRWMQRPTPKGEEQRR